VYEADCGFGHRFVLAALPSVTIPAEHVDTARGGALLEFLADQYKQTSTFRNEWWGSEVLTWQGPTARAPMRHPPSGCPRQGNAGNLKVNAFAASDIPRA
jgi:hypothetical protein